MLFWNMTCESMIGIWCRGSRHGSCGWDGGKCGRVWGWLRFWEGRGLGGCHQLVRGGRSAKLVIDDRLGKR